MDSNKAKNNSNPREKAKFFSILFWWWIKDLFGKGYTNVLTFQDLYEPLKKDRSKFLGNKLEKQWITELKRAQRINDQPNLFKTIFVTFRKEIFFLGIIHFFLDLIFRLGLPILLGLLLRYFNLQTTIKFEEAFIYFMAFILTNMLTILLENHLYFRAYHLAGRIRIAMSSLLYKKTLKLNSTVLAETSTGKIVNLLANDVNRFEFFIIFLHTMWTAPLATLIVAYILYIEAHFAGLIGLIIMLSSVLVQVYTGKLSSKYRLESAKRTDKRVRLVDEIISGVHVIKMFVWEKPFYALVEFSRFLELRVIKKSAYIRGLFMTIFISITRIALYCTIIAMLMMGEQLTIDKIFVFGSFYNILSYSLTGRFVRSFAEMAECKVSVTRIQSFLLMEEFQADNIIISENVRAVMCKDVDDDNVEYIPNKPTKFHFENQHGT